MPHIPNPAIGDVVVDDGLTYVFEGHTPEGFVQFRLLSCPEPIESSNTETAGNHAFAD